MLILQLVKLAITFTYLMLSASAIQLSFTVANSRWQQHSMHSSNRTFAILATDSSGSNLVVYSYYDDNLKAWGGVFSANIAENSSIYQVRTFNNNINSKNYFIVFNDVEIKQYSSNFSIVSTVFSHTGKIFDVVMGEDQNQLYILLLETSQYPFIFSLNRLYYGNLTSLIIIKPYIGNEKVKMVYKNNRVYLNLQEYIKVYFFNSTDIKLYEIFSKAFNGQINLTRTGMAVDPSNKYLCFFTPAELTFLSIADFTIIGTYNFYTNFSLPLNAFVLDLAFINSYYLILVGEFQGYTILYQADHQIMKIVSNFLITSSYTSMLTIESSAEVIVINSFFFSTASRSFYSIKLSYLCDGPLPNGNQLCTVCQMTYYLNQNNQCQKNYKPPPLQVEKSSSLYNTIENILNKNQMITIFISSGKALTLLAARISPKSFLSFAFFLNDLQLYKYHMKGYPKIMEIFTSKVNLVNEIRLVPWYLDFANEVSSIIKNSTKLYQDQNNLWVTQLQLHSHSNPSEVYFMTSSTPILADAIINTGLSFLVLKVLHLVFYLLRHSCSLFKSFYEKLKHETMWWTILVGVLELNMTNLSFNCSTQLLLMSSLNPMNKFNAVLTLLMLFSLLTYSTSFYLTIKKFYKMKCTQVLIYKCRRVKNCFFVESTLNLSRNFLRSGLTGIFVKFYEPLIWALTAIDLFHIAFIVNYRKVLKDKFVFIFSLVYSTSFMLLDGFFWIQIKEQFGAQMRQYFCLVCLCLAVLTSILLFICLALRQIRDCYKILLKKIQTKNRTVPIQNIGMKNGQHYKRSQWSTKSKNCTKVEEIKEQNQLEGEPTAQKKVWRIKIKTKELEEFQKKVEKKIRSGRNQTSIQK